MNDVSPLNQGKKNAPAPDLAPARAKKSETYTWALTDHCCRACFGRVLVRETFDRRRVYRCACCGVEQEGRSETVICSCGMKLKTGVDAGIRCMVADAPTPEFPAEVIAAQAQVP